MARLRLARRLVLPLAGAALATSLVAGSALAGEVNGSTTNPKHYFAQGRSACIFSGLNDDPNAPFPEGGRTQSYGQIVRQGGKDFVPSPGVACNPTSGFEE